MKGKVRLNPVEKAAVSIFQAVNGSKHDIMAILVDIIFFQAIFLWMDSKQQ